MRLNKLFGARPTTLLFLHTTPPLSAWVADLVGCWAPTSGGTRRWWEWDWLTCCSPHLPPPGVWGPQWRVKLLTPACSNKAVWAWVRHFPTSWGQQDQWKADLTTSPPAPFRGNEVGWIGALFLMWRCHQGQGEADLPPQLSAIQLCGSVLTSVGAVSAGHGWKVSGHTQQPSVTPSQVLHLL